MSDEPVRRVTVAVVEDMDVVIEGVRHWIEDDPEHRATMVSAGSSIEAVLNGPGKNADVIVLDLDLHRTFVTDRVAELSDAGHRVVVFSIYAQPAVVRSVLDAGACAFLEKHTEAKLFVDIVVTASRDDPYVTTSMAGALLTLPDLTERERDVLMHMFQGMDYHSIANRMTKPNGQPLSWHTVRDHADSARAKLAAAGRPCKSNFALLARSIELGLIRADQVNDYRSRAHSEQSGPVRPPLRPTRH